MSTLPPWMTIAQVAQHCEVDRTEVYKTLPDLEVCRIGVRGGVAPWGRLIRVERGSVQSDDDPSKRRLALLWDGPSADRGQTPHPP